MHDHYVRRVNAAIGRGRPDLARSLADEYLDEALRSMTDAHPVACERYDCAMCARTPVTPRRPRWWRRLFS
jgi:hypothetical protein